MKTFKVELSPKLESSDQPHHVFMTVAECIDMDDCINHIHHNHPALQIESIKRCRMTLHDLELLALLLSPAMLMSVLILFTFAAGGDMTTKQQLQQQLAYAQEQLMIADSMEAQTRWGIRCDQLEAGIEDLYSPTNDD